MTKERLGDLAAAVRSVLNVVVLAKLWDADAQLVAGIVLAVEAVGFLFVKAPRNSDRGRADVLYVAVLVLVVLLILWLLGVQLDIR